MSGTALALASIVLALGGLGATGEVRRWARLRRLLRSGAAVPVDGAPVTLRGEVRAIGELLHAPLSGTPCVAQRSTARVRGNLAHRTGRNRAILGDHVGFSMVDFALRAADCEVIVSGPWAELELRPRAVRASDDARLEAFLESHQVYRPASRATFEEIVIVPGQTIIVHGIARFEISGSAAGERGFRDAPTQIRIVGDEQHPLTISTSHETKQRLPDVSEGRSAS